MALPTRTRPSFPFNQFIPSGSFHKASYPSPSEDRQNENHSHRKLTKLITWTIALSNSMKLWAMPRWAIQDRWDQVESSDKMWSTEQGMANHMGILVFRIPWTVWKGKKIWYWKMNPSGWKGPHMLLEKRRENAPEGMKRLSQSGNNAQLWMCLVLKE